METELIHTPGLGNAAYLLAAGREAVVVDPPRDAWRIIAAAEARGWRITHVVETHVHNDYLSGALELHEALGAEILAPARGRYRFAHRAMEDGDTLELGGFGLTARATPGHTPEHLSWDVTPDGVVGPSAVLTGGSLLVGSAGRTDLLGDDATDGLTRAQFHSLQALAALPAEVTVLPTHGAGSFCSVGPTDGPRTSTIGRERASNPLLRPVDEEAFRTALLAGLGPYPTYYAEMAPINRAGPVVVGRPSRPALLPPTDVRAAAADGARIVDGRSREAYAAAHIRGSLEVELGDSFASYVGWHVPFGAPLVLVLPEPFDESISEAATQLFRIGFDRVVGVLDGGIERYGAEGGDVTAYPIATPSHIRDERVAGADPFLLDVRDPHEWRDDGVVPGAATIPLGELAVRLDELPHDRQVTVMCRSGLRAGTAASLLDAAGIPVRLVAQGGALDVGVQPGGSNTVG